MATIICDILTIAVILGSVIWAAISDRKRQSEEQNPQLCDQCKFLKQKFSSEEFGYRYICSAEMADEGYFHSPQYCRYFKERSSDDSQMDTRK